jgi:hypothetical protein
MAQGRKCAPRLARALLFVVLSTACLTGVRGQEGPVAPAEASPVPARLVTGHEVFQTLVKSHDVAEAGSGLEWQFLLLNDKSVNAHSDSKGRVWVGGGLAELLGEDRGLWAAVLSHEIAHCLLRHSSTGLTVLHHAFPYVFGKVLRDREHRADLTGMMLMARAGYHPDSLFVLHHLLRTAHGEQPGAVAFFGSHPRWETREQRLNQALPESTASFTQAWPDAATSPGGEAPMVVLLGRPQMVEDGAQKLSRMRVPLSCRNARQPVTLVVRFEQKYPAVRKNVECVAEPTATAEVELQAAEFNTRKLPARVEVWAANGALRARSEKFTVRLPKP